MDLGGIVVGQDLTTAGCGLFNAGYFGRSCWSAENSRARRWGAGALSLAGAAAAAEAALSQALFWWGSETLSIGQGWPAIWALAKLPLFAATVLVTAIVMRRLVS